MNLKLTAIPWLRMISIVGVTAGSIGILAWLSWVFAPPCISMEPIASGVCPAVPSAAEEWAVLVVLILIIGASSFVLVKSYGKPASERNPV